MEKWVIALKIYFIWILNLPLSVYSHFHFIPCLFFYIFLFLFSYNKQSLSSSQFIISRRNANDWMERITEDTILSTKKIKYLKIIYFCILVLHIISKMIVEYFMQVRSEEKLCGEMKWLNHLNTIPKRRLNSRQVNCDER